MSMNSTKRIHFSHYDDRIFLLKGVVEVKDSLVVQFGQQVHLPQGGRLFLGASRDELCSIIHLPNLLAHPFHIRECTSGNAYSSMMYEQGRKKNPF